MTALIETVRVIGGRVPLWPLHAARIRAAAEALGIPVAVPAPPSGVGDVIVRMELDANGARERRRDAAVPAGLRLGVSALAHPGYPWKTTDRAVFDAAGAEAEARGLDDALLLSADGAVMEASRWAVVWLRDDGRIGAPPLASGVLRSVARARLDAVLKGALVEETVEVAELVRRPVAALNAARGLVPVLSLEGRTLPSRAGWAGLAGRFWP